jgi:ribosomal protein L37E
VANLTANYRQDKNVNKNIYLCPNCGASVSAHNADCSPMGIPANKELRKLRFDAHELLEKYANKKHLSRTQSYLWLAKKINKPYEKTHIGGFTYDECQKANKILRRVV